MKEAFDEMKSVIEDDFAEMSENECCYHSSQIMICALKYLIEQPNISETIIFEYPKINLINKDGNVIELFEHKISFGEFYSIWLNQDNDETYIENCNLDENKIDITIDNSFQKVVFI